MFEHNKLVCLRNVAMYKDWVLLWESMKNFIMKTIRIITVSEYWDLYDVYYYVDIKSDSVDTTRSYFSGRM